MENYNHNCLVFATHKLDEGILDYLAYLKKEVEGVMDLLVLYDQSAHPIKEDDYPGFRFCFFESVGLKGFFHQNERLLPNTFVALAECAEQYRYDHYLLMENHLAVIFSAVLRPLGHISCSPIHDTQILHRMIECIGHPFVHILAFVKFRCSPGNLETVAEIFKLPNQIIAVIRHSGQQEFIMDGIITCHELCHVR